MSMTEFATRRLRFGLHAIFAAGFLACSLAVPLASQEPAADVELLSETGSSPALAADIRSGFVVVWVDTEAGDEGLGIRGCVLEPKHESCGPRFAVNTTAAGLQFRPAVAADDPGRFVVVWQGDQEQGTTVFGQRFGAGAVKLGPEILLSPSASGHQQRPRVAMEKGGAFVATWQDELDSRPSLEMARFSAKGRPLDTTASALRMKAEHGIGTGFDDGTLVASYRDGFAVGSNEIFACPNGEKASRATVSRFDAEGQPVGTIYDLGSDSCSADPFTLMFLVGSRSGALAVFAGPEGYSAQRFTSSGEPEGDRVSLTRQPACNDSRCERAAAVALDDKGQFAVVWEVTESGATSGLFAQIFKASGEPRTERIPVNTVPARSLEATSAALAKDGTLLVAWRQESLQPEPSGLFVRRLRLQ